MHVLVGESLTGKKRLWAPWVSVSGKKCIARG